MTNTTSAISSSSAQHHSPAKAVPISTELSPITGYVLCFCKEVVEFETVYQAMLKHAEELNMTTDFFPASTISLEAYMIDGLMSRLQEKAKGTVFQASSGHLEGGGTSVTSGNYFDPSVRAEEFDNAKIYLFLINNLDVICSHIRGRLDALHGSSPNKKTRKSTYRGTLNHQPSSDDSPVTVLSNQYASVDNRIQIAVNELCSVISTILLTCINLEAAQATAEQRTTKSFTLSQSLLDKQLKTCFGVCRKYCTFLS